MNELTPFEQGYKAYRERKGVGSNPFKLGTKEYELWFAGWRKANREDGN